MLNGHLYDMIFKRPSLVEFNSSNLTHLSSWEKVSLSSACRGTKDKLSNTTEAGNALVQVLCKADQDKIFRTLYQPHPHTTTSLQALMCMSHSCLSSCRYYPLALSPVRILIPLYSDKEHTWDELPTKETFSWSSLSALNSWAGQSWVDSGEGIK